MTTRKQDAESIVGSAIAEELEEKERSLVGKSEAEVIKSEEVTEERSEDEEYAYRPFGGATTLGEAKSFIESGKEQRRIGDIWYAFQACLENIAYGEGDAESKSASIASLADEFKGMVKDKDAQIFESLVTLSMDSDPKAQIEELETSDPVSIETVLDKLESLEQSIASAVRQISEISSQSTPTVVGDESHPLSTQLAQLRSDFDQVSSMDVPADERLRSIQPSFDALGEQIRLSLTTVETIHDTPQTTTAGVDDRLIEVLQKLSDKVDMLAAQNRSVATPTPQREAPRPRSIPASQVVQQATQRPAPLAAKSTTPVLSRMINRSVGLED